MNLNVIRLIATLRLEADIPDRYALFGIKPYFEDAFRQAAGCGEGSGSCTCPYHQLFSQPLSADPAALKRYQKPSLPFVFHIPTLPEQPNRQTIAELELVLVGPALTHVSTFLAALEGMQALAACRKKLPATLIKVESVGYDDDRALVAVPAKGANMDRLVTLSLQGVRESTVLAPDTVALSIVTPMLILTEGRPLREFSFSPFMRALIRRVSSLAYYYGESEAELDYKWLARQSHQVECLNFDFHWVEWGRKRYGVIGTGVFRGDLTDFHQFLLAGELLHVGKEATSGLGRFILERAL
ncbi:MAG TPA: CRISPR system precrRNA processing endoribonuclease RAMP protein Cas6 [Geobacteraceae bacterium]|nr:CRISPR system precrRNA processing endoribonuclease RAMP protein Cas6 [Geobacteraceae bacterium]